MKNFIPFVLCILLSNTVISQGGFSSITPLTPVPLSQSTKDKPQAKVWTYAGKWWCVLPASTGTKVFRLDGKTWTDILTLNGSSSKPDCRVVNDMVHILFYKGAGNNSYLYSLKFANGTYGLWATRPEGSVIRFPEMSQTATIVLDQTGRMWAASNAAASIQVWWSDAPYTSWSAPITVATGVGNADICALTEIKGKSKIGVLWSNQNTKRFGFKTHTDDSSPTSWSTDEVPASQSTLPGVGSGMADDHLNIKAGDDGTLYCVAKTDYNRPGLPQVILMVRRPAGNWDNVYQVTAYPEGTQPIVLLNEARKKIRVVYTTVENGGDILYRESGTDNISFGAPHTLISGGGNKYDYSSSSHQNHSTEVVILATKLSSNLPEAVGVLASDNGSVQTTPPSYKRVFLKAFPNPFATNATLTFTLAYTSDYTLTLFSESGVKEMIIKQGRAEAGVQNTVTLNGTALTNMLYLVKLQTDMTTEAVKVLVRR